MGLRALVAGLFRALEELSSFAFPSNLEPRAWRRESPESAMRTAARRLDLSHARGRVWGELKTFVSAGLVDGWGTCVVVAKFRRPLELGLRIVAANSSAQDESENLGPVKLNPSIAKSLRAYASEPDVAHPLHDEDELSKILEALVSAGAAIEQEAEAGRMAYR